MHLSCKPIFYFPLCSSNQKVTREKGKRIIFQLYLADFRAVNYRYIWYKGVLGY